MIGQQINQFRITEKIGQGGMGEVYLAEDTRLHRNVALKFLPPHYSKDPEFKARFEHEARAAAALNHPNIVTIYDLGEHTGRNFIVMELVEGQTLDRLIKSGELTLTEAVDYAQQICEGLGAAHEAGIVHRDIKPANILVGKNDRAKILDFGLAKSRQATTETREGTTVGTVQYESPEQTRGDKVDQRSDLFSFGVVLYEMITAQRPFKGEFEDAIRYSIANENPEPLARYKSDVPDEMQRIVSKLLEKDPEVRYQSAAGVVSDLKLLKRTSGPHSSSVHSAIPSAPPASAVSTPTGPKKKRVLPILVPTAVVILAVVVALVFKPWQLEIKPSQDAVAAEDRLAVMYFDNLPDPDDSSRLSEMVTTLLITSLSQSKSLKVLSSQRLYDILKQLGKEGTRRIDRDMASQVARKANAQWMLTGTILQTEPRLVMTAQVIDVASGQVEASERIVGEEGEEIFSQVDRLAAALRTDFVGQGAVTAVPSRTLAETMTHSEEAYRLYLEGLELNRQLYGSEARDKWLRATQLDSTFAMAWFWLANRPTSGPHSSTWLRKAVKYSHRLREADRAYIIALSDYFAGDYQASLSGLRRVIELEPDNKDAYGSLAYIYSIQLNQLDSAIYYTEQILSIDPLAKTHLNALAYYYKDARRYDEALETIDRYIELVPEEANPYDSRGEILLAAGRFPEAIASFRTALQKDPTFGNTLLLLGIASVRTGDFARADSCIRVSLTHSAPSFRAGARVSIAMVHLARGHFTLALDAFDQGLAADRLEGYEQLQYLFKYWAKARALSHLGRHDEAIALAREAERESRRIYPDAVLHYEGLAVSALVEAGRVDEAAGLLTGIQSQLEQRGSGHLARGEYDLAAEQFAKAAELNRRTIRPESDRLLAQCYIAAGRPADAIPLLERYTSAIEGFALQHPVYFVQAQLLLGRAYAARSETEKAAARFKYVVDRWGDGDPGLPAVEEARRRLAELGT